MILAMYIPHFRAGDVLLSINDASLEEMALEDVQSMIKNCPRGDVRVVAQAGPKESKQDDAGKETISSTALKEHGHHENVTHAKRKAEEETLPEVFANSAVCKPQVDMPSELISQGNSEISTKTAANLSNNLHDAEHKLGPVTSLRERLDDLITTEECDTVVEDSGLEGADLPPPIPPPPVPTGDWQIESSPVSLDKPLVQDTVQDVSLKTPTDFDDFFDERDRNSLSAIDDAEMDGVNSRSTQFPGGFAHLDSQSPDGYMLQKKEESLNKKDESLSSEEDIPLQIQIKPPSLFGDDTDSIPPALPRKVMKSSIDEDPSAVETRQWNGLENSPIKPPSLFDDDEESLPSLPHAPPPPKPPRLDKKFISVDTVSSNSSSPVPSWFYQESPDHTSKHSNISAVSGSSSRSHGHSPTLEVVDPFNDGSVEPLDGQSDDMASLPPAPPPPLSGTSSYSVRSPDAVASSPHGSQKVNISSPQPVKPERKNSKIRILPLRIRSRKVRKTSEQSALSSLGDTQHELSPETSPKGFGSESISGDVNGPPEDEMDSLPPAPPPPRLSPLTVENWENISDGLQPMKVQQVKPRPSRLSTDEQPVTTPTGVEPLHSSQHSPKRKNKSFRRHIMPLDEKESLPESTSSSTNIPVVSETDLPVNRPLEDDVAVTDSSDAMSPPPLPPEMELWSEAGLAEAELALLDQILTLEDSSRSGNEQSSEGGSPTPVKRPSFSKDLPIVNGQSLEIQEVPAAVESEDKLDQPILSNKDFSETSTAASSLQELPVKETERTPELKPVKSKAISNVSDTNEDSESESDVNDDQEATASEPKQHELSGMILKQLSEGHDTTGNLVKHRRPAPPIPARPAVHSKTSTIPRKSLPSGLGIQVLPSRPDIRPKAAPPPHEPTTKHKKEQQKLSSPVKEKSPKKLFSKGHKGKDKTADLKHLEPPDAAFESTHSGRERSRSWTKKLFGFGSRSKSADKSKDQENRSRSVSPSRGLFSRSRRSSPPPPPPSSKKVPLSEHKNERKKGPVNDKKEKGLVVDDTTNAPVLSPMVPSTSELDNPSFEEGRYMEGNNNTHGSLMKDEEELSRVVERGVPDDEPNAEDVVSTAQAESYYEEPESKSIDLNQELQDVSESDSLSKSVSTEGDDVKKLDVHVKTDTSLADRRLPPPPPPREKPLDTTALASDVDEKEEHAVEDRVPKKSPSKPPVPKKPVFIKSGSTPKTQQQRTIEELKFKCNKVSSCEDGLEAARESKNDLTFDIEGKSMGDSFEENDDLPSPGPPTFKPAPPPLSLPTKSIPDISDGFDETADSPRSPGPPQFKPPPPPLALSAMSVQNDVNSDKTLDPPSSPGPPRFKPAPPPIDLLIQSKNIDFERSDVPSTGDLPNVRPLPPIPNAGVMQEREGRGLARKEIVQDASVGNESTPAPQNDERRKTKPLPPIPAGFSPKTKNDSHKLSLSRQNAEECDISDNDDILELLEPKSELSHSQGASTEDFDYTQVAEPLILQNAADPVHASNSDDFSSEVSSEWDDTCSSTQGDPGPSLPGNKFTRSASFSIGDVHIQRPPAPAVVDDQKKRLPVATMRPPPPMRRRSSSLPQLFPAAAASEGGVGEKDYWLTGNLQQLINRRNQEPDVDEGITEVQVSQKLKNS